MKEIKADVSLIAKCGNAKSTYNKKKGDHELNKTTQSPVGFIFLHGAGLGAWI